MSRTAEEEMCANSCAVGMMMVSISEAMVRHLPVADVYIEQPWIVIPAALAIILPFVGILYCGIQMIFAFKSPSWKPGLVILVLWLISLVVLGVGLFAGFATKDYIDSIETLFP